MTLDRDDLRTLAVGTLRLVKAFKHAQDRRSDLDRVTFEILLLVQQRGQVRPSDIADELNLNPSSITRRMQGLRQAGRISMSPDPADQRASLIGLTKAGEDVLALFLERSVDGLEHMLADWRNEDVRRLGDELLRYAEAMCLPKGTDTTDKE